GPPRDVGLRAVAEGKPWVSRHGALEGVGRPVAPAEKEVDAALIGRERVRRRGGDTETPEVCVSHRRVFSSLAAPPDEAAALVRRRATDIAGARGPRRRFRSDYTATVRI